MQTDAARSFVISPGPARGSGRFTKKLSGDVICKFMGMLTDFCVVFLM